MIITISEYNFTPCFCIFNKIFFSQEKLLTCIMAHLLSCVLSSLINKRQLWGFYFPKCLTKLTPNWGSLHPPTASTECALCKNDSVNTDYRTKRKNKGQRLVFPFPLLYQENSSHKLYPGNIFWTWRLLTLWNRLLWGTYNQIKSIT